MAKVCNKCQDALASDDLLMCFVCKKNYHYLCLGLNYNSFKKMRKDAKQLYKCPECKFQIEEGNENIKKKDNEPKEDETKDILQQDFYNKLNLDLKKWKEEIQQNLGDLIRESQEMFRKEIKSIREDIIENQRQIQANASRIQDNTEQVSCLHQEISSLTTQRGLLDKDLKSLKCELNQLQQHTRKCNIEVNGLQELPNENPEKIAKSLAKLLNQNCDEIVELHRVPTRTKLVRPIIIKLANSFSKANWVTQAKKLNISNHQVLGNNSDAKVYVNEHLSHYNKQLLFQAKKLKENQGYSFVWVKNGSIFVRKDATANAIKIISHDDLMKLK